MVRGNLDFKKNPNLEICINKLYLNLKDMEYGAKFSWNELATMCGPTGKIISATQLYYVVKVVDGMMQAADKKLLGNVRSYGKRIINPEEHSLLARRTVKRSVKIYKKAGMILHATNLDKLDKHQQKEIMSDAQKYKTLEFFAKEALSDSKAKAGSVEHKITSKLLEVMSDKSKETNNWLKIEAEKEKELAKAKKKLGIE